MSEFVFIFSVIAIGFSIGQVLKRSLPGYVDTLRHYSVYIALRIIVPLSLAAAIWQLALNTWTVLYLPFIGVSIFIVGFLLGLSLSKLLKLNDKQKGVYAPAGGYTNIGSFGSLAVLVFLGESGVALLPLFKLFEEVVYYAFFFPYAAKHSDVSGKAKPRAFWRDPILITTMTAVALGFALNFSGIERPAIFADLVSILIPLGTLSLMISVGLSFQLGSFGRLWKKALLISVAKQVLLPAIALGIVFALGIQHAQNGLILQVVFLLAAMPMAFIVVLPAAIYKLDQDLASLCWTMSFIVFLCVLPFFPFLLKLIGATSF